MVSRVVPAFGPIGEFGGQDECDGDLTESLPGLWVGVAEEVSEVGEPGVGAFD